MNQLIRSLKRDKKDFDHAINEIVFGRQIVKKSLLVKGFRFANSNYFLVLCNH